MKMYDCLESPHARLSKDESPKLIPIRLRDLEAGNSFAHF